MIILGAGLSGLIAAVLNPQAKVYEMASRDAQSHKAVLRFRTGAVGDAVGIPFRKIRVHKGIHYNRSFCEPNVQLSNLYSQKVTGGYYDRSIWKTEAVDRYIAPEDFILRLIEQVGDRVLWETQVDSFSSFSEQIISTIPMNRIIALTRMKLAEVPAFKHSPIRVQRYRISNSDVFQTIYYPSPMTAAYRASITGDLLIVESVEDQSYPEVDMDMVLDSFGILGSVEQIDTAHKQSYGKIAPINEQVRRFVVEELSRTYKIYSLGRFATWRNILLDDVLQDLNVIKRLINADSYTRRMVSLKG